MTSNAMKGKHYKKCLLCRNKTASVERNLFAKNVQKSTLMNEENKIIFKSVQDYSLLITYYPDYTDDSLQSEIKSRNFVGRSFCKRSPNS
jgi:hypothetical protein